MDKTLLSSRFKILWLTLCQPHNSLEIEYLPVYTPSDEERENPALFASNVRKLMAKALEAPLTDLSFDDREISLSQGPLRVYDYSCLLEFNMLVSRLGQRAGTSEKALEEQARRARKLQGDRLGLDDFAQFLDLPVTDTLTQVHSMFDQHGDGQIDIRHYVIALSTVHRPSESMKTLKLAFKMYENKEKGEVIEEDLAAILEIMLGVQEVELSGLFLSLDGPDTNKITYDDLHHFIEQHPHFVQKYLDFKNHPRKFCIARPKSCNGKTHDKDD
ncbi:Lysophosphatidylcholine acyltransferase 1 [Collichthys lucidus]|uniref:Lysophosphatidylcholine acyltransferase 1 n=1 Tax=Collichthys lucidus TaxID=240159 RepID=A0A4U5VL98_COLLU|nr:Lysophosphatidylcholine acyltransferase 1 [Collichthys lucidus]